MSIPVLIVVALLFFWVIGATQRLKRLRSAATTLFAPLSSDLRQRHAIALALAHASRPMLGDEHALIVRLVETAQAAGHALDAAQARSMRGTALQAIGEAEVALLQALDGLALHLQDLTSGSGPVAAITELLRQRDTLQEQLAADRHLYNHAAQTYNDALHLFPTTLVATLLRLRNAPLLASGAAPSRGGVLVSRPTPMI